MVLMMDVDPQSVPKWVTVSRHDDHTPLLGQLICFKFTLHSPKTQPSLSLYDNTCSLRWHFGHAYFSWLTVASELENICDMDTSSSATCRYTRTIRIITLSRFFARQLSLDLGASLTGWYTRLRGGRALSRSCRVLTCRP